jgi:hypothetical protein
LPISDWWQDDLLGGTVATELVCKDHAGLASGGSQELRERLDVINIHPRAVMRRPAAEDAGRVLGKMRIAQPLPFRRFVEPFDQAW